MEDRSRLLESRCSGFSMVECWLRCNVRMQSLGFAAGIFGLALGVGILSLSNDETGLMKIVQWIPVGASLLIVAFFGYLLRRPRLGYHAGSLLIYAGFGSPLSVPIEVVEVFFLGEQPAGNVGPGRSRASMSTVVVRIAQKAKEYQARDLPPRVGMWREGYITLHGLWCQPINAELLHDLNRRLREVHLALQTNETEEAK